MRVLRPEPFALLFALAVLASTTTAFTTKTTTKAPFSRAQTRQQRTRTQKQGALPASRQQENDTAPKVWENNFLRSDIPSGDVPDQKRRKPSPKSWREKFLPPPPEDQFIMTGDIFTIFLYAFTSHSINDAIVSGLLEDPTKTTWEAVRELDPMHEVVSLQHPVWVDLSQNPGLPFGNPSLDHALEVSARESLLNHWGPLLSTEGSACVALCTCWLIAGYLHEAFLYDNSTYCPSERALVKTLQTWATASLLLGGFAVAADALVLRVPVLQSVFCVQCHSSALTSSDLLFIVDSLTVLVSWRWSAHRVLNTFR